MDARTYFVRFPHPRGENIVELFRFGYPEMVHEYVLRVRGCMPNTRVRNLPLKIEKTIERQTGRLSSRKDSAGALECDRGLVHRACGQGRNPPQALRTDGKGRQRRQVSLQGAVRLSISCLEWYPNYR